MAIGTNDNIDKFGTQDQIDDGTTGTVATTAFSESSSAWTNDDDARKVSYKKLGRAVVREIKFVVLVLGA